MRYRKLRYEIRQLRRGIPYQPTYTRLAVPLAFFTPQRCRMIACAFFVLMVSLGSIPGEAKSISDVAGDKLLHFCAYSFLAAVLFGATRGHDISRAWQTLILIGLLGGLDEALQGLMPYRNASWADWLVDMGAAFITVATLVTFGNIRRRMTWAGYQRLLRPAQRTS